MAGKHKKGKRIKQALLERSGVSDISEIPEMRAQQIREWQRRDLYSAFEKTNPVGKRLKARVAYMQRWDKSPQETLDILREYRKYDRDISPFDFSSHISPVRDADEAVVPAALQHRRTKLQVGAYTQALERAGHAVYRDKVKVVGSRVRFRIGGETLSLPLGGPVYSKTEVGQVTGYQGAVRIIRQGSLGEPVTDSTNLADAIMQEIRDTRPGDLGTLKNRIHELHRFTRHKAMKPYQTDQLAFSSPMDLLHQEQFRYRHTGRDTPISLDELQSLITDSSDRTRFEAMRAGRQGALRAGALHNVTGVMFGDDNLQVVTKGGRTRPLTDLDALGALFDPLLEHARRTTGIASLHWDPTSDYAPLSGRFSTFTESQLDPLGNLQKRGYKFAQQFRTLALDERVFKDGAFGYDAQTVTGGRMLRTHLERKLSARAAGMQGIRPRIKGGLPDVVTGVNLPTEIVFGAASAGLPEERSLQVTRRAQRRADESVGRVHPTAKVGITTPTFIGDTKTNIMEVAHGLGDFKGVEIHARRAGHFKRPAHMFHAMMSGYTAAALRMGDSWDDVQAAIQLAVGEDYFTPGSRQAVLASEKSLFAGMTPDKAMDESVAILQRMGSLLGVRQQDFIERDAQGRIVRMLATEHLGIREQAVEQAISYARHGMGVGGGHKIAQNYSAIFRGLGSDILADLFTEVRQDPHLMKGLGFRRDVLGTLGHLIDPAAPHMKLPDAPVVSIEELQKWGRGHRTEIKSLLDQVSPQGGYAGITGLLYEKGLTTEGPLQHLLGSDKAGFHLDLGGEMHIRTTLDKAYGQVPVAGAVSRIAIPNVDYTNIKDSVVHDILRLSIGEGAPQHTVGRLSANLLDQYLGGKHSLIAQLASPKVGSEMIHTVQKFGTLDPEDYKTLVRQYADKARKRGLISSHARAEILKGVDEGARYAFFDAGRIRELGLEHQDILSTKGYLQTLGLRDPIKGRALAMRLLPVHKELLKGDSVLKRLAGIAGTLGIVTGISDIDYLEGDTDFDRLRTLLAEKVGTDPRTEKLHLGFQELEKAQAGKLATQDVRTAARVLKEKETAQRLFTSYADTVAGGTTPEREAELRSLFTKTMDPAARHESLLGAAGVKALTGHSYSPAVHRQLASEAMHITEGVMSPFGRLDMFGVSAQTPYQAKVRGYYLEDFLPGMQQMFISKHTVAGKDSLQALREMTTEIKQLADQRAIGQRIDTASDSYVKARQLLEEMMVGVHTVMGGEVTMAHTTHHSAELFGLRPDQIADPDAVRAALKGEKGAALVDALMEAEIKMSPQLDFLSGTAAGTKALGYQYKDAYSLDDLRAMRATIAGRESDALTPVQRSLTVLTGAHLEATIEMQDSVQVMEKTREAARAASEAKSMRDNALRDVSRKEFKEAYHVMKDSVIDSIKAHPKGYAAAGIGAAALLALGVLGWVGRKADQVLTPAGQESGVPMSPRSEYYVPSESMAGSQLSGIMHVPPDTMPGMIRSLNQIDSSADLRIMDTRRGMSDRMLGYETKSRTDSLYARSQL
jgi:hypothetical protein